ncbi:MAG: hypothetical protein JXX28_00365 [Deltaproteobacteria bacterium]|nr:hypothetical protein [Deltaproteobacteria bacterium]
MIHLRAGMKVALSPMLVAGALAALVAWPVGQGTPWWRGAVAGIAGLMVTLGEPAWVGRGAARALGAVGVAAALLLSVGARWDEPAFGMIAGITGALALRRAWGAGDEGRPGGLALTAVSALALVAAPHALALPRVPVLGAVVALMTLAAWSLRGEVRLMETLARSLSSSARMLVISFGLISLLGGVLLAVPGATAVPGSIRFIDALFTSVSATCVTGLAVLDTSRDFTLMGQAIVLALIQVGGLGIMTFATAFAVLLGRRMGVQQEALAAELIGVADARSDLERALRTVLKVTFLTELGGAALLTGLFSAHGDPLPQAAWRGLFTAVSAFCNAGFALQSDSLVPYQHSPAVLGVVGTIIVIGGMGPVVIVGLPALRRGSATLQTRVVVWMSGALLVGPAALILAFEWGHTLAGMSLVDKLSNAWFQSITLRTAGFNSIDFGAIQPATWTVSILCMVIGGSPGSTAGGIKTTTMAVLLLAVFGTVRGRAEVSAFRRRIPHRTVYEATAITTAGVLSVVVGLVAIQLTQQLAVDQALFEVVSAFGTAGLSMGATGQLDDVGKALIMLFMFAGRVGPLTLFIFLAGRFAQAPRYPRESIQVG